MDDSHPCLVNFSGMFSTYFEFFFAPTVSDQTHSSQVEGNPRTMSISVKNKSHNNNNISGYADGRYGVIYIVPGNILFYLFRKLTP